MSEKITSTAAIISRALRPPRWPVREKRGMGGFLSPSRKRPLAA
jgi:hypothetical protein